MNNNIVGSFFELWQHVDLETSEGHLKVLDFLKSTDSEVLLSETRVREELCFAFIGDVPTEPRCKVEGEIRNLLREKWPVEKRWW